MLRHSNFLPVIIIAASAFLTGCLSCPASYEPAGGGTYQSAPMGDNSKDRMIESNTTGGMDK